MDSSWTQASLRVASTSLSAQRIEESLGKTASRMVEAGQPVSSRSSSVHDRAFCIFSSPLPAEIDPREHVSWAVEFLRSVRGQLASIGPEAEIDLRLGYSSGTGQGGFALSAEELALMGELGVQLNVDLYPAESDEE